MLTVREPSRSGRQTFCGPWAVACVTGRTTGAAAAAINRAKRRPPRRLIVGTGRGVLVNALRNMGHHVLPRWVPTDDYGNAPTLVRYMAERPAEEYGGLCIVLVTGHYLVIQQEEVNDRWQGTVDLAASRYRRCRVRWVLRVLA